MVFHCYNNEQNYGFTAVSSVFIPHHKPEPEAQQYSQPAPINAITHYKAAIEETEKRRLPGVALLKKLTKSQRRDKPLDMKMIEKSISSILMDF
jgi:hypothetical protein